MFLGHVIYCRNTLNTYCPLLYLRVNTDARSNFRELTLLLWKRPAAIMWMSMLLLLRDSFPLLSLTIIRACYFFKTPMVTWLDCNSKFMWIYIYNLEFCGTGLQHLGRRAYSNISLPSVRSQTVSRVTLHSDWVLLWHCVSLDCFYDK